MVAVGLAVLLGITVWVGVTWRLERVRTYYLLVAVNLAVWSSTALVWNTYAVILPIVLGALGSLLLALAGLRAAWRAHLAGDRALSLWVAGVIVTLLPFALLSLSK